MAKKKAATKKVATKKAAKKKASVRTVNNPVRSEGILANVVAPSDITHRGRKILLYGESAAGKTTFTSSFPKPMLIVQIGDEEGTRSLSDMTAEDGVFIFPHSVREPSELEAIFAELRTSSSGKYKTLSVETSGRVKDIVVEHHTGYKPENGVIEFGVLQFADYDVINPTIKSLHRQQFDLADQGHVENSILVAQEKIYNKGENEVVASDGIKPNVAGETFPAIKNWLEPTVDYILRACVRNIEEEDEDGVPIEKNVYSIQVGPHPTYKIKVRKPKKVKIPNYIDDPTFDSVFSVLG